jgi:hypothetical protein
MLPAHKTSRRDALLDSPFRCCTMCAGRLLTFGGASRDRAGEAPIGPKQQVRRRGTHVSLARLPYRE